jgi:hypothetical protein
MLRRRPCHRGWSPRCLLATRCLVAAALELYARGATADDVQLCLSLAGVRAMDTALREEGAEPSKGWRCRCG